jgi:nucleoside-diphosphate-sugar epimerase
VRILIVGGTRFVGRYLTAEASDRGHEVTVLHRGTSCAGAPGVEHLHADRDADLGLLDGRAWDATIDTCAYRPEQVRSLAGALAGRGGHHLLISTISVYADLPGPGRDEGAPLQAPLGLSADDPADVPPPLAYGRLKVGCELVARSRHPSLLIVRPTFVIGPHDHTGRFPAWVARVARGGVVLAPGPDSAPFQYIDVRDLARLCVDQVERGAAGTLHATAPSITWGELFAGLLEAVGSAGTAVTWAPSSWLAGRGVGRRELPLWVGSDEPDPVFQLDPGRALAAGLEVRPLADTIGDTARWLAAPGAAAGLPQLGLTPAREAELLSEWAAER